MDQKTREIAKSFLLGRECQTEEGTGFCPLRFELLSYACMTQF